MIERLKFRGKLLRSGWLGMVGTFHYSDCGENLGAASIGQFFLSVAQGDINPTTVGQWTGLVDKNGKEIYEGDVIVVAGRDETPTVEFRDGVFGVEVMEGVQIPEDVVEGQEIFYALSDPEVIMGFDTTEVIPSMFYAIEVIGSIYDEVKP